MELAIDSSSEIAGLALSQQGRIVAQLVWRAGQNHTRELLPGMTRILEQAVTDTSAISGVIAARGPGSFNGLRAGLSLAKGLAFGLKIPLVGVTTLEAEAYQFAFTRLPVFAVHEAGRGEIATALYRQTGDSWQCLKEPYLTTIDALCAGIEEETVLCGEITPSMSARLLEKLGRKALIPPGDSWHHRVGYLALLGWQRLGRGESEPPASLQPLYLRQPPITLPGGGTRNVAQATI
ncbi:MAG: tRNA (adenosine(37)-N6)-threonylcarbamoyltransferase complex dimerization subunit type 1 TsaB [Chloroflexota bacterium]